MHPRLRNLSIRTRIILMVVGTLVTAQLVSMGLILRLVRQHILSQKLTTTDVLTTSILHDITYVSGISGTSSGQTIVAKYMTYYRIIDSMTVYGPDLRASASSDPKLVGRLNRDPEVVAAVQRARPTLHVSRPDFRDLGVRSVSPILQGSRIVGAVVIDVSIQDVQKTLAAMYGRIAVIMGIELVLVSFALTLLLRGTILVRLTRLMNVTQQVIAGNYGIQVGDPHEDEIGHLGQAFDHMTQDLKSKDDRVRQATGQLQQAYEDLKSAQSQVVLNEKMASLGVLIAGIAHEINTPVGAILNVSRSLDKRIRTLPEELRTLSGEQPDAIDERVACLNELLERSARPAESTSYKTQKAVETVLRRNGVPEPHVRAAALCRLNFTDPDCIQRHIESLKSDAFFRFAESVADIAQAAMISQASSQKIAEIVRALKYYAHSDQDRTEQLDLNESINTALVLLRNHLKHSVQVSTELDSDLPRVECTSEIHQVWTNLLSNACDAISERGTDPGEIWIRSARRDDWIVVTITDNGAGIPADKIDRIFDPFFTTKDIGKGTGLGLSVVSGIVKKHHGRIRVESRPGHTEFEIALPIRSASADDVGIDGAPRIEANRQAADAVIRAA